MLTLVIGGAASGKSAYAEHLAVQSGGPRYYLATMQVWDAECAARVAKHRAMRAQKQFATECHLKGVAVVQLLLCNGQAADFCLQLAGGSLINAQSVHCLGQVISSAKGNVP